MASLRFAMMNRNPVQFTNYHAAIPFPPSPEALMTSTFDMAIDHFSRSQQATTNEERVLQIANGLQLFCAAVQRQHHHPDAMFQMAIDHFWRAQEALMKSIPSPEECLLQIASGLQLFCAATKRSR